MSQRNTTSSARRRDWTKTELLAAFRLYCHTPFGRLHSRNPEIVNLARRLGRTPAAVAMKACNFASLDPMHRKRSVTALGNTSAADRKLWEDFAANPERVAVQCEETYSHILGTGEPPQIPEREVETPIGPTETERLTRVRRVQTFFRQTVLASYENRCAISGIRIPELLNASHIVPWCEDAARRADPRNGIALNTLYDHAFDRGLITFDESLRVVASSRLRFANPSPSEQALLVDVVGQPLRLPHRFAPDPACIAYHRQHVFVP